MGQLVSSRRGLGAGAVVLALVLGLLSLHLTGQARGEVASTCQRYAAASALRARQVTGSGPRTVVIGDSYSVGLGLREPSASWAARLPGQVHVSGFSGSGFSEGASPCGRESFADRAPAAVRGGADLVVVEGGLNDYDQPARAIAAGFARLLRALDGLPVVVVGPVLAPSRAAAVPRVDALLAGLCRTAGVPYVRSDDLDLPYLADRLHLTPAGHATFGDHVAAALRLVGTR
ncbi:MAG: SGNH/GDSL hydrolase family protein [Mycobacteriales bacterium]